MKYKNKNLSQIIYGLQIAATQNDDLIKEQEKVIYDKEKSFQERYCKLEERTSYLEIKLSIVENNISNDESPELICNT
jgi:hypothetical protein